MKREIAPTLPKIEWLASSLADIFVQRRDCYARQFDDGSYVCIHKPLQQGLLISHLNGELTLGAYVLDQHNRARFAVLDADDDEQWRRLICISEKMSAEGIPSYLETSRRGGHLWLFFEHPIPGREARRFGKKLLEMNDAVGIELFPKQDRLSQGPGSLIRMPFGVHRRNGQRYPILTPDGQAMGISPDQQIEALSAAHKISKQMIEKILSQESPGRPQNLVTSSVEEPTGTLSQRIKASITVRDFVNEYVDLSPTGVGNCPFHEDTHASFAVNNEGNYWHCFAGCGGGSVIDFWMKWRKCDFTQAVRELAKRL